MSFPSTAVIIAALNEEERIGSALAVGKVEI